MLDTIGKVYGNKPTVGVFHSLSTVVPLMSFSEPYAALILFDPPLCKPGASLEELHAAAEEGADRIRRRGHRFKTREEFSDFLQYVPAYKRVVPGVRELMAQTILRETPNGEGYELRCPREFEAQLAYYARSFFPLIDLGLLSYPIKVIGADPTMPWSYLPSFEFSEVLKVDYDFIPETTHFLQLEKPEECAAAVREFLDGSDLS